jgi:hypothetical protein
LGPSNHPGRFVLPRPSLLPSTSTNTLPNTLPPQPIASSYASLDPLPSSPPNDVPFTAIDDALPFLIVGLLRRITLPTCARTKQFLHHVRAGSSSNSQISPRPHHLAADRPVTTRLKPGKHLFPIMAEAISARCHVPASTSIHDSRSLVSLENNHSGRIQSISFSLYHIIIYDSILYSIFYRFWMGISQGGTDHSWTFGFLDLSRHSHVLGS